MSHVIADDTNASCIEKLQIPTYPPLARHARWRIASQHLRSGTAIKNDNIRLCSGKLHRASVLAHVCGGKTVKLVFQFVLGDGEPSDRVQDVSFGLPNRFWISVPPLVLNPDNRWGRVPSVL